MKKLPKIYQNEINKKINNNKEKCCLSKEPITNREIVEETLDIIFNGLGYSYNIPVEIKTKDKIYKTSLISKTRNNIITLDNDVININDIINIEIKKKKVQ